MNEKAKKLKIIMDQIEVGKYVYYKSFKRIQSNRIKIGKIEKIIKCKGIENHPLCGVCKRKIKLSTEKYDRCYVRESTNESRITNIINHDPRNFIDESEFEV